METQVNIRLFRGVSSEHSEAPKNRGGRFVKGLLVFVVLLVGAVVVDHVYLKGQIVNAIAAQALDDAVNHCIKKPLANEAGVTGPKGMGLVALTIINSARLDSSSESFPDKLCKVVNGIHRNRSTGKLMPDYSAWLQDRKLEREAGGRRLMGQAADTFKDVLAGTFDFGDLNPGDWTHFHTLKPDSLQARRFDTLNHVDCGTIKVFKVGRYQRRIYLSLCKKSKVQMPHFKSASAKAKASNTPPPPRRKPKHFADNK